MYCPDSSSSGSSTITYTNCTWGSGTLASNDAIVGVCLSDTDSNGCATVQITGGLDLDGDITINGKKITEHKIREKYYDSYLENLRNETDSFLDGVLDL